MKKVGPYDYAFKRLLALCTQDFFDWCIPGAVYTGTRLSGEFQSMKLEADGIFEGVWQDDLMTATLRSRVAPILKWRSGPDILPHGLHQYRCVTESYVIYLRKGGPLPKSPLVIPRRSGKNPLVFDYEVIPLWETPIRSYWTKSRRGLLPFVPLSLDGASREVVEEIIERLHPAYDTISKELLSLNQFLRHRWLSRSRSSLLKVMSG